MVGAGGVYAVDGGAGSDTVHVAGNLTGSTFTGGAGTDTFEIAGDIVLPNFIASAAGFERFQLDDSYIVSGDANANTIDFSAATQVGGFEPFLYGLGGDDILAGGNEADFIFGGDANDTLKGGGGGDYMSGGAGNDILNGGTGADAMRGEQGDDLYYVDNAGDRVSEAIGSGVDRVLASVSYALIAGQEIETLATTNSAGTGAIDLTGNELGQSIKGNAGANVLKGLGGNDIYVVGAGDLVDESVAGSGGIDLVRSSVSFSFIDALQAKGALENLTLTGTAANGTGNTLANIITGDTAANVLSGREGNDTLHGGAGGDTLIGGPGRDALFGEAGDDTFRIALVSGTAESGITTFSVDTIGDWSSLNDSIDTPFAGSAANYFEASTSATTIGAAATAAESLAPAGKFYAFLFNGAADTGYLLADLDKNGAFETGAIITGAGAAADFGFSDII